MLPRIFHPAPISLDTEIKLIGPTAAHIGKVLRLREKDSVILFSGDGLDHTGVIISVSRHEVVVRLQTSQKPATESPIEISLLQGICRNQRMDLLVQKSTELGVHDIRPVITKRSVTKLSEDRAEKRRGHWQNIAISACEQCGRTKVPTVHQPATLADACDRIDDATLRLLLDPGGKNVPEADVRATKSIATLIGPEGGLTSGEREIALRAGFRPLHLGPRILRTETAPLTALSIIQYLAGDLRKT